MIHRKLSQMMRRQNKRRPTGVSRRQKQRQLSFEPLEDRRVMSANPVTSGIDEVASQIRDVLLDSKVLSDFAQVSDLSQYSQEQLVGTEEWIVLAAKGVGADAFTAGTGVNLAGETGILPWSYVVDTSNGSSQALIDALSGSDLVDYFYPLVPFELDSLATTNDPFLENQWHLVNFGQNTGNPDFSPFFGVVGEDINVEGAWDIVTGEGVVIGIVDSGTLTTHPDLAANIRTDLAIDLANGDFNPNPSGDDAHGTATAGIAAGVGNNGIGITGVAYEADIAPIRLFSDDPFSPIGVSDLSVAAAFLHQAQEIDIYNHSWGFTPPVDDNGVVVNPRAINELGPLGTVALRNSVFFGRKINQSDTNGLGGIHVFAAGNSRGISDGGNFSELVNSRYTIGVTSVIETGRNTTYAEAGASVLVAAPSGSNPLEIIRDEELGSGIYSTDLLGDTGFNQAAGLFGVETDADFLTDTDYTSRFNGTSASAPIVSGVIALMLEANPFLTYRDVQHILVRAARQNIPNDVSWITNNQQLFNDPLNFDVIPSPDEDVFYDGAWSNPQLETPGDPGADPPIPPTPITQAYYQQPSLPFQFTNGAGFTVSQVTQRTESGFAHGVVDAALAVELASNWVTLGGQTSEFTWTTGPTLAGQINAAAISSEETGEFRVPGGVVGDGDPDNPNAFIDFFDEFGVENDPGSPGDPNADPPVDPEDPSGPFSGDDPPVNTRGGFIAIAPPAMTVEWVEVELNLIADDANAYDFLRVILVSPDGTQSELKNYHIPDVDPLFHRTLINASDDPAGNLTNDDTNLNAVFTTNRHWGERTEGKVRLNTDGTPVRSFDGTQTLDENKNPGGLEVVDGWRLVFENFGESVININTFEVAFHGINAAGTGRIQGAIGVDDNTDSVFSDELGVADNFTRYVETNLLEELANLDPADPSSLVFIPGQGALNFAQVASLDPHIVRGINTFQESWADGITVYADLNLNGQRDLTDPSFQVGNDGNYYFDLPAGDYDIRIDPNSLDAAGLLNQQNLDLANNAPIAQATISVSGERVDGFAVEGDTITAFGTGGSATQTSVSGLNALLTPNAVPANIINLSGFVYSDLNGNGVRDGDDGAIADANVFIDINQNGVFTPGFDLFATTDGNGFYEFVDQAVAPGFYSVEVLNGTTGTFDSPVNPDDAEQPFFLEPEFFNDAVNFGFETGGLGGPGSTSVAISGIIFNDANNNGSRDGNEEGMAGIATPYLDLNGNNVLDAIEPTAELSDNGSYTFNSLTAGFYTVRIEFDNIQYELTTPAGLLNPDGTQEDPDDFELRFSVLAGQVASGNDFGLHNLAVADYGDLPSAFYPTTLVQNGARHTVFGDLFLGEAVEAELDGPPGSDGTGDDTIGIDDEDGITFSELQDVSTTLTITVDANTNGGFLQGWIDFNENHIFEASERVFDDVLLIAGTTVFDVDVPAGLTTGTVFARFRYGEQGIDSITGLALKGEVEDYAIPVVSTAPDPGALVIRSPDFDADGDIDGGDFLSWQRGFGTTSGASDTDGDANGDGAVNGSDLVSWTALYGIGSAPALAVESADFDSDGDTDGGDFLAWQRGYGDAGSATFATGDANSSGNVDGQDLGIWAATFGAPAPVAAATSSGSSGSGSLASFYAASAASDFSPSFSPNPSPELLVPAPTASVAQATSGLGPLSSSVAVAEVDNAISNSTGGRLEGVRGRTVTSLSQEVRVRRSEVLLQRHEGDNGSAELGFALRDQALDHLFAGRQNPLLERATALGRIGSEELEEVEETEETTADAFAAALGQQIDWRFA